MEKDSINWSSEEFERPRRSLGWYVLMIIGVLLIVGLTIYLHQWLLGALVIMIGVVVFLSGRLQPRQINYRLDKEGFWTDDKVLGYNQLRAFWFSRSIGGVKLHFISSLRLMPIITVGVTEELVTTVRELLKNKLPETEKHNDWVDRISKWMKL